MERRDGVRFGESEGRFSLWLWFWLGVVCEEACAVWTGVRCTGVLGFAMLMLVSQRVATIVPPNIHAAPRGLHSGCRRERD